MIQIDAFVNVGWGKKETQFHGSLGKSAAKTETPKVENSISEDDDLLPRISWRGDGSYFVVSVADFALGKCCQAIKFFYALT